MELLSWSVAASFNAKGRISPRPKSLSKQPVQCWILEMMVGSTWFQDKQCYHDVREVSEQGFKGGCTPCPSRHVVCCRNCVKQLTENGTGLLKNVWQDGDKKPDFLIHSPLLCLLCLLCLPSSREWYLNDISTHEPFPSYLLHLFFEEREWESSCGGLQLFSRAKPPQHGRTFLWISWIALLLLAGL